ncbi:MAG: LuxR C-terminal-related transcriptional regulator, partial [Pseudomonadota bacterium]
DALETGEVQYQIPILLGFLEKAWLSGAAAIVDDAMFALGKIDIERFSVWTKGEFAFWAKLLDRPTGLSLNSPLTSFDDAVEGNFEKSGDKFAKAGAEYLANICYGLTAKPALISQALKSLRDQKADAAVARLIDAAETRGIRRDRLKIPRGPYNASRQNSLGLTAKEQVVLKLLGEGLSNSEIAQALSRSPRTIEHHVSSVLQKMNVENRMAAVLKLKDEPWHLDVGKDY